MYPILDVENSNSENPDFLGGWASQTFSEFQWFFLGTNPAISGCLLVDSRSRWTVAKCFPLSSQCHDTTDIHLEFPRNILPWFHEGWKFRIQNSLRILRSSIQNCCLNWRSPFFSFTQHSSEQTSNQAKLAYEYSLKNLLWKQAAGIPGWHWWESGESIFCKGLSLGHGLKISYLLKFEMVCLSRIVLV